MSMGLLVGFIVAYPMNWWLVAHHLKHGMMTVRPAVAVAVAGAHDHGAMPGADGAAPRAAPAMAMGGRHATRPPVPVMALLLVLALAAGIAIAWLLRRAAA